MSGPSIRQYLLAAGIDPARGPADAELVAQFATAHDEGAFELLVWRHAGMVQKVCHSVLRDHHWAEDAAQATFLVLARKAGTISGRGTVVGWLYRVARRVAFRLAKQRARLAAPVAELADVPAADMPGTAEEDSARAVCAEVDRLPERYRVPVLLCFFEGLTHAEAAKRAGVPVGTIAGRLARAKELLARRLSRRGVALTAVTLPVVSGTFAGSTASAATAFAAGRAADSLVSQTVLSLAHGATKTMTTTLLKAAAAVIAVGCVTTATVWALAAPPEPPRSDRPTAAPVAAPVPPAAAPNPGERNADAIHRMKSSNNLKMILIAVHNYHDANGHLPQNITDKTGKVLLSWRVLILPYIEQEPLYKQFKLDEPWDSANNKPLLDKMPAVFRTPGDDKGSAKTYYRVFAGPGTVFEPGRKGTFTDVTDGLSNTIGVIEAGPPVEWSKPDDIAYDPKKDFPKLTGPYKNVFVVGLMDGSTMYLRPDLKADMLRLLVERSDGQPIPEWDDLRGKFPATTKEEKEFAAKMLKENQDLLDKMTALLVERQKLLAELLKKEGASGPDIEDLLRTQEGLRHELDRLKKELAELKESIKREK